MIFPVKVLVGDISMDALIVQMFNGCTNRNRNEVGQYTGLVDTLKLIIETVVQRNEETVDVSQIFKQSEVQVVVETIRQNRMDLVERIFTSVWIFQQRNILLLLPLPKNLE